MRAKLLLFRAHQPNGDAARIFYDRESRAPKGVARRLKSAISRACQLSVTRIDTPATSEAKVHQHAPVEIVAASPARIPHWAKVVLSMSKCAPSSLSALT